MLSLFPLEIIITLTDVSGPNLKRYHISLHFNEKVGETTETL